LFEAFLSLRSLRVTKKPTDPIVYEPGYGLIYPITYE